jgi:acyl-CoA synthetase (AMP-forming)/AMP-acid ligase II
MALLLPSSIEFLHLQAERRGDAGGLFYAERRLPYGEISRAAAEMAAWLARQGYGAGDHVAILMANSPALVTVTFASWGVGTVTVPIGTRNTVAETAHLLSHARARALFCDAPRADAARAAAKEAGVAAYVCETAPPLRPRVLRRAPPRKPRTARAPRPDDLATIAYTSGTTGSPKGVMVTHANLLWAALACGQARGDHMHGVGACISALSHTPVFVSHLLCRVLAGAAAVLLEKFDLSLLLESVERFGVTDLPLIGGMVFDVVGMQKVPATVWRRVEKVSVGGAPTPMEAKRALAEIFPRAEIIEAYGQSESTDGVTMARGTSVFDHPGTVGTANPYVVVGVRRPDGTPADVDEEGEIVIGGPTVMSGYYRNPAATQGLIRDGLLHTGDFGRCNREGYFFITGRVKDIIITGGENVSPLEVEDVLRTHPDVADVAVIGTPHPKWGEQVTAVVVARDGARLDPTVLSQFAAARLAGFKKPRRFEFVNALPRNAANKVQVHLLRQRFAQEEVPGPGSRVPGSSEEPCKDDISGEGTWDPGPGTRDER